MNDAIAGVPAIVGLLTNNFPINTIYFSSLGCTSVVGENTNNGGKNIITTFFTVPSGCSHANLNCLYGQLLQTRHLNVFSRHHQ